MRHGEHGGVSGLMTCGSVWACPVCSAKIAKARQDELESGIRTWVGSGGSMAMLTLTVQHTSSDRLADVWDLVSDAWRRFVSGRAYKEARAALGVQGYHRTTEVVQTVNGWHVHLHVLYFVAGAPGRDASEDFGGKAVAAWQSAVRRAGGHAAPVGQDWKLLAGDADALRAVAGYMVKGVYTVAERVSDARAVAMEATRADLKDYAWTKGTRTPFMLLADLVAGLRATGELGTRDWQLWREWEAASKGRRQQIWSRGLRDRLGLGAEQTDEELAEAATEDGPELVRIVAREWRRVARRGDWHAELLELAARGSFDAARAAVVAFLERIGVEYREPPSPVEAPGFWSRAA